MEGKTELEILAGEKHHRLSVSENLGVENPLTFVKYVLQTMMKSIHLSLHLHTASQFYDCFKEGSVFPARLGCLSSDAEAIKDG